MRAPVQISAAIPCGRIEVLDASDPELIRLRVPPDPGTNFIGWYNFRASGVRGRTVTFVFEDVAEALAARMANREDYADKWTDTGPMVSEDGVSWRRIGADYDGRTFSFTLRPERDIVQICQFPPFGPERDAALVAAALAHPDAALREIGQSVDGRPLDLLTFGAGADKPALWIVARQHPSETQGGFLLEGLFERLLDPADATARMLLARAELNVVVNANPDGSALGLSRSNAARCNLNRAWVAPDPETTPEVAVIRAAMMDRGVDFFLDCHADGELRCNFIWPSENVPTWRSERWAPFRVFEVAWALATPDYETGHPYPGGCPAEPDLSMGWNWVGNHFPQALSVLLEQPFKDVTKAPVPSTGWSPDRARALGRSLVSPLLAVLPHLGGVSTSTGAATGTPG
ncbi:M14 family metallopeptidase [Roseisalinus antarcticus]|uniref:Zinc carboxypeptidase n=1 Tax=Roseisalinus antarcticus TaxID=254357 RepID=A0A1Y5T0T3_9RHOB|nr:M14-type cytosolic carboxypeptidase [Roseisalinus antarcticus]SLN53334.1 Zinc carboxypeptidase [Roseisalinus antarcticus]